MADDLCKPSHRCDLLAGFTAAYDRAGNRLYERHLHSECRSYSYQHDQARRLTGYQRGKLTPVSPYADMPPGVANALALKPAAKTFQYNLDPLGNWNNPTYTLGDDTQPPADRTHDLLLNQIDIEAGKSFKGL
jgi:hypothetical protein